MDGNLFVYVEWFPVAHAASLQGFLSEQMSLKKVLKKGRTEGSKKEWHVDGLTSHVQVLPVFNPEVPCTTTCWST